MIKHEISPMLPKTKFGMLEVVVVVVVYLTTNQRLVGYLSSGNGHLAGRYSTTRFERADAIGCSR